MQLADDIYWTCPRCLLSALPFADVSNIELVNNLSIANSTQTTETTGRPTTSVCKHLLPKACLWIRKTSMLTC